MVEQSDNEPFVRKSVSLSADLWRRIEDYQFKHRVKRDADAVRRLLELGLQAAEKQAAKKQA